MSSRGTSNGRHKRTRDTVAQTEQMLRKRKTPLPAAAGEGWEFMGRRRWRREVERVETEGADRKLGRHVWVQKCFVHDGAWPYLQL